MLNETDHDYQSCLVGNYYDNKMTGTFHSWEEFKDTHLGFTSQGFDDTYHFVFRYDIHKLEDDKYNLELCMMLQRKGIYTHLFIHNIDKKILDTEVYEWLKGRSGYLKSLWEEVIS
jgi:hypothetical protein